MDDFLLRALLGGFGVALVAGPFGSFVVWRRLAYFGDTLAHSALLGVALGFLLHINLTLGIVVICQLLATLLFFGQRQRAPGQRHPARYPLAWCPVPGAGRPGVYGGGPDRPDGLSVRGYPRDHHH